MSRNSITPSRALRPIGDLVLTSGGSPFGPGRQSRTPQAQDAIGLGEPTSSTRHMRQLPAIDSRSWKQNRGISAPAASHACSSVNSGGTSISLPSMFSLVIALLSRSSCVPFEFPLHSGQHDPIIPHSANTIQSFSRDRHRLPVGSRGIFVDAPLDLGTEVPDQALDRPRRRVAERANRVTLDLRGDFEQQPDLALARAP